MQSACCTPRSINNLENTFDRKRAEKEAHAYLEKSAKQIANALKFVDRVHYVHMDFAQSFDSIESADMVILDRVICCYPLLENLLAPAAARATRYLALSYPREDWWGRLVYRLSNIVRGLRKSEFFTYVHSHASVHEVALQIGLFPAYATHSGDWQVTVFERQE